MAEPIYPIKQYIGARYVPIFGRKNENTIEWDNSKPYEPLSVVTYQGNSYTSKQYVPSNVEITNATYWAETGNYNAQIESYRREVKECQDTNQELKKSIGTLNVRTNRSYIIFGDEWAISMYDTLKSIYEKSETHIFATNNATFDDLHTQATTALADETVNPVNITDIIIICGVHTYDNNNTTEYHISSAFNDIASKFPYSTLHYYPSIKNNGGDQGTATAYHTHFIDGANQSNNVQANVAAFNYLLSIIGSFNTTTGNTLSKNGYAKYARYIANTMNGGQYNLPIMTYPYVEQNECVPALGSASSSTAIPVIEDTTTFSRKLIWVYNHPDGTVDLRYHLRANLTTPSHNNGYWKLLLPYQIYKDSGLNTLPIRYDSNVGENPFTNSGLLTYTDNTDTVQTLTIPHTDIDLMRYTHSDGVQQVYDWTIGISLNEKYMQPATKITAEVWGSIPFRMLY